MIVLRDRSLTRDALSTTFWRVFVALRLAPPVFFCRTIKNTFFHHNSFIFPLKKKLPYISLNFSIRVEDNSIYSQWRITQYILKKDVF